MKILIFWDIFGRIGRQAFADNIASLREKYSPDFTIVNVENMTSGKGPILKHYEEMQQFWIDVMTGGNHTLTNMDQIKDFMNSEDSPALRPANYYDNSHYDIPGRGTKIIEKNGQKLLVMNLMSNTFMTDEMYNPFLKAEEILAEYEAENCDAIVVDFHRETTSESQAMAHFLDGKVSFVFWTHTHCQTNDEMILDGGTGTITDIGMVGPRYSVIGWDFASLKKRFVTGIMRGKIEQSLDERYVMNGVCITIQNKKCTHIEKIRIQNF